MQDLLLKLEQIQEIDFQISSIRRKIAEMPTRLASFDHEIKLQETKRTERQKAFDELEKNLKQQRGALELNETRAKRSQEKLDQIKTNQEYTALQKEIESLKKNSAIILENAQKVEKEMDGIRKEVEAIAAVVKDIESKKNTVVSTMGEEQSAFDSELEKQLSARKLLSTTVEVRYLSAYERIRDARMGVGIVRVVGGSCKGCNMRIPPQMYNEILKGGEIHTCPSCRRILFNFKENLGADGTAEDNDLGVRSAHN